MSTCERTSATNPVGEHARLLEERLLETAPLTIEDLAGPIAGILAEQAAAIERLEATVAELQARLSRIDADGSGK